MKGAETRRQEIIEEYIGTTGKRVFLVEGENDRNVFSEMAEKKFENEFEQNWIIAPAGGKNLVVGILSKEPDWLGLVDRDEWTEETIAQKQNELPNLNILPRFCLENYIIEPSDIWNALPEIQKNKISGGIEQLKSEILADHEKWLRHGVLRTLIQPLWDGLIARGFQNALLDFENAQDDGEIKEILKKWHSFLNPDDIFNKFQEKLEQVREASDFEQISLWIDGKTFFASHVHKVLNNLLGQTSEAERKKQIFKGLLPDDLEFLWEKFNLQ
ncbi:DUF4435 [Desulfonema limicola]|uniref:DUF4435 n=1 Tax=Desulfonema limicola TaxID=45656 RepID=A0A975B439_9BACT|nr:DUF4435 [Desulfonema limicola]